MLNKNRLALQQGFVALVLGLVAPCITAQTLLGAESGQLRAASIIEFLALVPNTDAEDGVSSGESLERGIAGVRSSHAKRQDSLISASKSVQKLKPSDRVVLSEPAPAVAGRSSLFLARRKHGRSQIRFDNIPFDNRSYSIPFDAYSQLDEIGVALLTLTDRFPTTQFILESYAGDSGDVFADKELSTLRAKAIKRFLVARFALNSDRLAVVGLGSDQQNLSVKTINDRELNRVVQLVRIL